MHWLLAKDWFTELFISFICCHTSLYNIKKYFINIIDLIRNIFKFWQIIKPTMARTSFPEFCHCKLEFGQKILLAVFLKIRGSLHLFPGEEMTDSQGGVTIVCPSFFQVNMVITFIVKCPVQFPAGTSLMPPP